MHLRSGLGSGKDKFVKLKVCWKGRAGCDSGQNSTESQPCFICFFQLWAQARCARPVSEIGLEVKVCQE